MAAFLMASGVFLVLPVFAQPGSVQMPGPAGSLAVTISVRDRQGGPLRAPASVRVYSTETGYEMAGLTGATSDAVIAVPPGLYTVEVRCDGYQPARSELVVSSLGADTHLMVVITPAEGGKRSGASAATVMSPQLERIAAKGLDAMRDGHCDAAEKQFQKGVKIAPGNPDLSFLLGTAEYCLHRPNLARKHFEKAVNLDPSHARALLSLGEMQLSANETALAIATLETAQSVSPLDWRVHTALANAYWRVGGRLNDAEAEAALAVKQTNSKIGFPRLLLGEIQYARGNRAEARKTWQQLVNDLPSDPAAVEAKHKLDSSVPGESTLASGMPAEVPNSSATFTGPERTSAGTKNRGVSVDSGKKSETIARPSWPPADGSNALPSIEPGPACNAKEVVRMAGQKIQEFVENVQRFTATESSERETINKSGEVIHTEQRTYEYVVSIEEIQSGILNVEEYQLPKTAADRSTQTVMNLGLPALLLVFHPYNSESFTMDCEGLTSVNGRKVWQVYFRQEENQPNKVRRYRLGMDGPSYRVDLHGRAWFDAASYQIIKLQADLIRAIPEIQLTVDHTSVEYGPVNFNSRNIEMWVPQTGELFSERKGRRFHERLTFSGYLLFAVDDRQKITTPKAMQ